MRAAGPARTLFTSPRWDCRFWALTWLRRHWRSPERRPTTVASRLGSLRLTRSSWTRRRPSTGSDHFSPTAGKPQKASVHAPMPLAPLAAKLHPYEVRARNGRLDRDGMEL